MTLAKVKARANKTFAVQASIMIVNNHSQNILIIQATGPIKISMLKWLHGTRWPPW
jgi:hypothetical protein